MLYFWLKYDADGVGAFLDFDENYNSKFLTGQSLQTIISDLICKALKKASDIQFLR